MRRALALLLALSIAAGGLALGTATTASAVAGEPTIDGPTDVFVSGNSITVTGTDPVHIGGTVDLQLNSVSQSQPTVQPDGTWSGQVDLTGLIDARYLITVYAGNAELSKNVWINRDLASLQITSPASGATVTSSTSGCIAVSAALNAPGAVLNPHEMVGYLMADGAKAYATVTLDGTTASTCLPIRTIPNGAATLWLQLNGDTRSYIGRVQITLDLYSQVTASAFGGSGGVVLAGAVTEPGPDTVLTSSLDGGAPETVTMTQGVRPTQVTSPWTFTHYDQTWVTSSFGAPYFDRALADGPHSVTLTVTSRGVTTQHGPFDVAIDGDGKLVIDAVDTTSNPGNIDFSGTLDSIGLPQYPDTNLRYDAWIGGQYVGGSTTPQYTWHYPGRYGEDRWLFRMVLPFGAAGPVVFQVSARDFGLDPVCTAVTVVGATVTPTACKPVPPGVPTGFTVTSTSPTTAKITFIAPTSTGGAPILDYTAQTLPAYAPTARSFTSVGATPSISLSGLPPEADVAVAVTARTSGGSSYAARTVKLYGSSIFCNANPKATLKVNTSISVTCGYMSGVANYDKTGPITVSLQGRKPGSTVWTTLTSKAVTSIDELTYTAPLKTVTGKWSLRLVAPAVAVPAGLVPGISRPAISRTMTTLVTGPAPTLTLAVSKTRIAFGTSVTFTGKSTPTYKGQKVFLMRYSQGGWGTVASTTVSSTGVYSFTYKPTTRYDFKYRIWTPAANGRPAGNSPALLLTVL